MKTNKEKLRDWAINKITTEHKDKIALLIGHDTLRLNKDKGQPAISYYIPVDEPVYALSKTFIIDGIGYDLFPRTWHQLDNLANLDSYNISCLGDVEILYYRNKEDRDRFQNLQSQLKTNLNDNDFVYVKALDKVKFAVELFQEMLFCEKLHEIRVNTFYIADFLSIAIAYINNMYYANGQTNQMEVLKSMNDVPKGFVDLYANIISTKTKDDCIDLCHKMIELVKSFISNKQPKHTIKTNKNFTDLADWYQELSYTFRRIYHFCETGEVYNAFAWSCMMQSELQIISSDFALEEFDLLSSFNADDIEELNWKAHNIEKQIIKILEEKEVTLCKYRSIEEFLLEN